MELTFQSNEKEFIVLGSPTNITVPVIDLRQVPVEIIDQESDQTWKRLNDPQVVSDTEVSVVVRTLRSMGKQVLALQTGSATRYVLYTCDT